MLHLDRSAAASGAVREAPTPSYLGHRARLRRRLVAGGPRALLDQELLEMVLFLALPRRDTKPMAQALVRRFGGFAEVVSAPPAALDAVAGLGEAGVAALKAVEAAGLRLAEASPGEPPASGDGDRLSVHLSRVLAHEPAEQIRALFLDPEGRLLADEVLARGAAAGTPFDPREVVRRALEIGATALTLVRHRPDGDAAPTAEDLDTAAAVRSAAAAFGIELRDHLIIGARGQASLQPEGLL